MSQLSKIINDQRNKQKHRDELLANVGKASVHPPEETRVGGKKFKYRRNALFPDAPVRGWKPENIAEAQPGPGRVYVRILREQDLVRSKLDEINTILDWSREDLDGRFHGMVNHRLIKREKRERLKELCTFLMIKDSDKAFAKGYHLLQLLRRTRSRYFRVVDIVGGPRKSKIDSKDNPFGLSKKLPGSFESRQK